MFDLRVEHLAVDLPLVGQCIVLEAESSAVSYLGGVVLVADLEQDFLVVERVARVLGEGAEGEEVVGVDTVKGLQLRGEGAPVHDEHSYFHLATQLGLSFIKRNQRNLCVFVAPIATPSGLHITTCQLVLQ